MKREVKIEKEWKEALRGIFETNEFIALSDFVRGEYQTKKVFPAPSDIFRAFELTPFSQVKVVILGQDPYHGDHQAHGLCFSVPDGVMVPPSLKNVYKEIASDIGIKKDDTSGNLESWAKQGVFLLNAILTVVAHAPASHQKKGWEIFTDKVIETISSKREHVVFMLWGNYARSKKGLIDTTRHLVLEAPHPSPFSVHSGFFGCKHFSKCNEYLRTHGGKEIIW
jgi:uracil-DNA glycosylase